MRPPVAVATRNARCSALERRSKSRTRCGWRDFRLWSNATDAAAPAHSHASSLGRPLRRGGRGPRTTLAAPSCSPLGSPTFYGPRWGGSSAGSAAGAESPQPWWCWSWSERSCRLPASSPRSCRECGSSWIKCAPRSMVRHRSPRRSWAGAARGHMRKCAIGRTSRAATARAHGARSARSRGRRRARLRLARGARTDSARIIRSPRARVPRNWARADRRGRWNGGHSGRRGNDRVRGDWDPARAAPRPIDRDLRRRSVGRDWIDLGSPRDRACRDGSVLARVSMLGGVAVFGAAGALVGPLLARLCVESLAILSEPRMPRD